MSEKNTMKLADAALCVLCWVPQPLFSRRFCEDDFGGISCRVSLEVLLRQCILTSIS